MVIVPFNFDVGTAVVMDTGVVKVVGGIQPEKEYRIRKKL